MGQAKIRDITAICGDRRKARRNAPPFCDDCSGIKPELSGDARGGGRRHDRVPLIGFVG